MLTNLEDIDKQLTADGLDYLIYDRTTNPKEKSNWVIAEDVRYYGHFYNSLKDFIKTDHDIFIFNAGDTFTDSHAQFTRKVEQAMSQDEDIWLMGPRMVNDGGDGETTLIAMSKKYDGAYGLTIHFNGIWIALHRTLAEETLNYLQWLRDKDHLNFTTMVTGHCLDTVYAMWTLYNNKKAYRDWNFQMVTGVDTSYPVGGASRDCEIITRKFFDYANHKGYNQEPITKIYQAINNKMHHNQTGGYPILKAYPNLKDESDLDY